MKIFCYLICLFMSAFYGMATAISCEVDDEKKINDNRDIVILRSSDWYHECSVLTLGEY